MSFNRSRNSNSTNFITFLLAVNIGAEVAGEVAAKQAQNELEDCTDPKLIQECQTSVNAYTGNGLNNKFTTKGPVSYVFPDGSKHPINGEYTVTNLGNGFSQCEAKKNPSDKPCKSVFFNPNHEKKKKGETPKNQDRGYKKTGYQRN